MTSCHERADPEAEQGGRPRVALVGNPNVGKSALFNALTGGHADSANYPGTTVEITSATTRSNHGILVSDLPGTYSLQGDTEDQIVARRFLLERRPSAAVVVVDATNLARNLFLVLEVLDLGFRTVVALNFWDEVEKQGIKIDVARLSRLLHVPVVPTVATDASGLDALVCSIEEALAGGIPEPPKYDSEFEEKISAMEGLLPPTSVSAGLTPRGAAILFVEEPGSERHSAAVGEGSFARAAAAAFGEEPWIRLASARHALASDIAKQVLPVPPATRATEPLIRRLSSPAAGFPVLIATLLGIFFFVFFVGTFLSDVFSAGWRVFASLVIDAPIYAVLGQGALGKTLVWGFDAGIGAALAVGIPFVLTFYFIIAFLEDTGYLGVMSFLVDKSMRRFGLDGRSAVPLVAGLGCNVPAIIGTRVLNTRRQRLIASTLIVLTPCSARTAVIMGAVGLYIGFLPALGIYLFEAVLILLIGMALHRMLPERSAGLVVELYPLRRPQMRLLLSKTWYRFKAFLWIALPMVTIGSFILGALYETGALWALSAPLSPAISGWLGLPAAAGLALVFAVLRKELALQLLAALGAMQFGTGAGNLLSFMTPTQIVVFAVVATIYVPCIATVAVLGRELRWRAAAVISLGTIAIAFAIGGILARVLQPF